MPRLALAALLALAPTAALADIGEDEFTPVHLQQLVGLEDFSYDTDWFPMDAALQLRLIAHAGNSVTIKMPGQAIYDWTDEHISFLGDPDAGTFDLDIGLELDAKIRFDVLGQQWESSFIGPYDYAVISGATYTPYLLFENPDRPLEIDDQTDPITFVSVPVTPDIIIASGHLDIDAYVIVAASLECVQIEAATPEQLAVIMHLHPSTLSGILKRLERRDLLSRRPDPRDRRRALLALTALYAANDNLRKLLP